MKQALFFYSLGELMLIRVRFCKIGIVLGYTKGDFYEEESKNWTYFSDIGCGVCVWRGGYGLTRDRAVVIAPDESTRGMNYQVAFEAFLL